MAKHKEASGKGGEKTPCSPRATENNVQDSNVDSIATHNWVSGQGINMTSDAPTAMETETVVPNDDMIARTVGGHRRGERGGRRGTRRGMLGTLNYLTHKRVTKGEQNKEIRNLGSSKRRGSLLAKRLRSRENTLFSWLIDCKIIKEGGQVWYEDSTGERAITGKITRGGILCSCCQEKTSAWTFEKHAGSDLGEPYEHIYTINIVKNNQECLKKCLESAWKCEREQERRCMFSYVPKEPSADPNDDTCPVCGDGGDLICCDKCPSTYHLSCVNMETVPQNDWFCSYCACKFCGLVVKKKKGFKCSQCRKKCHWECIEKEFLKETLYLNPSRPYCEPGCREIYEKLEVLLGIPNDYSEKYSWTVICRISSKNVYATRSLYCNPKIALTWMLMNEAFETIIDPSTGINVIQSIVYRCRSNLTRIDYRGFYMFVLEKDDKIIAAASIRFHGKGIAEMPLIATDTAYRRQGVCQDLMSVIESFLRKVEVKHLIIPSAPATCEMWKRKFNFTDLSEELEREISSYNILMFRGCLRLSKDLSASIADDGDDIEDNQSCIKNDLEPQMEQAEGSARLEHGPSPGRLEAQEEGIVTDGK